MRMVSCEEINKMIGNRVKAVGCCGMTDGVVVTGVLESFDNWGTIVVGTSKIPMLVNKNTLELINGACDNCGNVISDAEAFNAICFKCGKKP